MTLKPLTPVFSLTLAVLALAGAGCSTTHNPAFANQNRNLLNFITIEPDSFAYRAPQTFELRSNDIIEQPNMSGTKISFLGGIITYVDY